MSDDLDNPIETSVIAYAKERMIWTALLKPLSNLVQNMRWFGQPL